MSAPDPAEGDGERRVAAFFDLDKTVIAKSSTLAFGRELYREGLLTPAVMLKGAYAQFIYQLLGANEERMERSRVAMLELTRGWEAERVQRLVRETLQAVLDPLIYAEALELFEEHRRVGQDLYLVSSSGIEVVRPMAEYLGVPYVLATLPGVDEEGFYDGTLGFYCYGPSKAEAMDREAAERNIDLEASFAYSDSITDLPMLEAVGNPVAVNPDRALRAIAQERGFEIRDFTRPVAVRSRIPQVPLPSAEIVAGAGALGAAMLAGFVLYQRRQGEPRAAAAENDGFDLARAMRRSLDAARRPREAVRRPLAGVSGRMRS